MKTIVIPQFYRGPSGQKGLYNRQEVGLARAFAAVSYTHLYCREYLMQDPILTEALLTSLDDGQASVWLRSQKYTLDFIDYCLRLL